MKILGDLEQKIMDILWESKTPLSVKEVVEKINSDCAYTTIMTVMKRLCEKELLVRKLNGKTFVYVPYKKREEFAQGRLKDLFNSIIHSYGELAISQFVDSVKGNKENIDTLKKYVEDNEE